MMKKIDFIKTLISNPDNDYFSVHTDDYEGKSNFSGKIELDNNGFLNVDGCLTYWKYNSKIKFGHVTGYCYLGESFKKNLVGSPRKIGTENYNGGLACAGKIMSLIGHPIQCQHMDFIWHEEFPILELFYIKGLQKVNFSHGHIVDGMPRRQAGADVDLDPINNLLNEYLPHGIKHMTTFILELGLLDPKWHGNLKTSEISS